MWVVSTTCGARFTYLEFDFVFQVLIVLDFTVNMTGADVGKKLGEPVTYDPNKNVAQQQQHQPQFKPTAPKVPPSGAASGTWHMQFLEYRFILTNS